MLECIKSTLFRRVTSALILIPLVAAIVLYGGWIFWVMVGGVFVLTLHEWLHLAAKLPQGKMIIGMIGVIYVVLTYYSFGEMRVWFGPEAIIIFMVMVWASDVGAYMLGKTIGGPKMAPKISPNKTWAGLCGAMISPAIFGSLLCWFFTFRFIRPSGDWKHDGIMFVLFMIFGLVCQIGDLLVSVIKRRAGVKDTGHLIPGHGGILDRIDAMMLAAPAFDYFLKVLSWQ